MDILYYSNYCKHSQKTLQVLVKGNITDKISFICIDKRVVEPSTNQTYIVLENGSKVVLPPNIHSVPSLLLVNKNYKVILGDDIIKHYHPEIKNKNDQANKYDGEPSGFLLNTSNGGTNIVSEQYTLYDMSPEELSAKGIGERRSLYNYVSANGNNSSIKTPPDTYRPDKISESVTVELLQQTRTNDIANSVGIKPPPFLP
jgi:hypothetical protein